MSSPVKDAPVVIVGGGPVGMLTALGLARSGVAVTVLEGQPGVARAPRAMVYHWPVLEHLERLGILEEARKVGFFRQSYCNRRYDTGEEIHWGLECLEGIVKYPFAIHLGQDAVVEIILAAIEDGGLPVDVKWGHQVVSVSQDEDHVALDVDTPDGRVAFHAPWVVAADGSASTIRYQLGIEFAGFTWPERFVATNVRYPFEENDVGPTTLVCDRTYGTVIAKIDGEENGRWRFTYSEDPDLPQEGIVDRFPAYVEKVLPHSELVELVDVSPYRMHQRSATAYRGGRVLLAGDAAHVTNPVGALGLTGGMFDSFLLGDALASVVRGSVDATVLDRYAAERKRVFDTVTSPSAIRNKDFAFRGSQPQEWELAWENLKRTVGDERLLVERCLMTKRLDVPSLVGTWE